MTRSAQEPRFRSWRRCVICEEYLPKDLMAPKQKICKKCRKRGLQGDGSSKASDRNRIIDEAKAKPCMDCGRVFGPEQLDFDHVRDKKFQNISELRNNGSVSLEMLKKELAKCDVVCVNCHRIRTRMRELRSRKKVLLL